MRVPARARTLSEPTKKVPNARVVEWLWDNEREIAVDPIILGEVRFGILLLRNGRRRTSLERWFNAGVQKLRCLPWEAETGLRWAQLLASLRTTRRAMPSKTA
jgi:toxin FitB